MEEVEGVEGAQAETCGQSDDVKGDDPPPDFAVHRGLEARSEGGVLGVRPGELRQRRPHPLEGERVCQSGGDGGRRGGDVAKEVPL